MKKGEKREDIMLAAMELIAERGFHGSPMSEIAERAGVATGTIYHYFENRDVLINELHLSLEEKIQEMLREGCSEEQPIRERFLFLVGAVVRYFVANPLHYRYMEQYFNSPYGVSRRRDKILGEADSGDVVSKILSEGVKQGIMKNLPEGVLFALTFGPLLVLMRDHVFGFETLDEKMISRIVESCWDAVRSRYV